MIPPRTTRRTKQKEAVAAVLSSGRLDHPSADEIYAELRRKRISMSLGTLYRNLAQMTERGEIMKISGAEACDRFDITVAPHAHFKCLECGAIVDIDIGGDSFSSLVRKGFEIDGANLLVFGKCPRCAAKRAKKISTKRINTRKVL